MIHIQEDHNPFHCSKPFIDVRYVEELLKYELDSRSTLVMVFVLGFTLVSLLVSLMFSGELGSSSD